MHLHHKQSCCGCTASANPLWHRLVCRLTTLAQHSTSLCSGLFSHAWAVPLRALYMPNLSELLHSLAFKV